MVASRRNPGHLCGLLLLVSAVLLVGQPVRAQNPPIYPATDRAWSPADYRDLIELVKSGKAPLPSLADPAGKPVFERMVNLQNFDLARNQGLPVATRIQAILEMLDATKTLLLGYLTEAQGGKPYERELAKLQVHMVAQSSVMLAVVDEFLPTIPKDEKYQARMAGFEKMRQGLRTIVAGSVESTAETTYYSKPSTLEFAQGLVTYLPALQQVLTDADRQDFARRIGRQLEATTDADLKAALARLQEAFGKKN